MEFITLLNVSEGVEKTVRFQIRLKLLGFTQTGHQTREVKENETFHSTANNLILHC